MSIEEIQIHTASFAQSEYIGDPGFLNKARVGRIAVVIAMGERTEKRPLVWCAGNQSLLVQIKKHVVVPVQIKTVQGFNTQEGDLRIMSFQRGVLKYAS